MAAPLPDPTITPGLVVTRIERAAPAYVAERRLRYEVLRRPLGMPEGSEENTHEVDCWHWVALDASDSVVGCVLWLPGDERRGRLLQMAVAARVQGQGIGRLLVGALERDVRGHADEVTLHARADAVGFYERLGYAVHDAPFTEVGIPHRHMHKRLAP